MKNNKKRDTYKIFLEVTVFLETTIIITWLVLDMFFSRFAP